MSRREVVLPAAPSLGSLYARGAAASLRLAARARRGGVAPTLPAVEHVLGDVVAEPDHLTAYQHLLGEPASDDLPAGYVHVLAFPVATALMVRPDFPLPLVGLVHLANRVEQARPLRLGERLEVRAHAADLRPHRAGTQVDLVTRVRAGAADDVVWHGVSTYLAKGVRLPLPGDDPAATRPSGREAFVPPTPTGRWRLPADRGRRYAAVSGDRNPIHLSPVAARAFGFPRAIAHGMDTAARALAVVGPARTGAFTWTVEFAAPVVLPATVDVRVAPERDGPGVGFSAWSARSRRLHLAGSVLPH